MKEYRCTRITPFGHEYAPRSPAFTDKSARQGHYIHAEDEVAAYNQMAHEFPEDIAGKPLTETFTVDFHKDVYRYDGHSRHACEEYSQCPQHRTEKEES
jgi:hypothetical protein